MPAGKQYQKRIQNLVNHLRWRFLQKQLKLIILVKASSIQPGVIVINKKYNVKN